MTCLMRRYRSLRWRWGIFQEHLLVRLLSQAMKDHPVLFVHAHEGDRAAVVVLRMYKDGLAGIEDEPHTHVEGPPRKSHTLTGWKADVWTWFVYGHEHGTAGRFVGPMESERLERLLRGTSFHPEGKR